MQFASVSNVDLPNVYHKFLDSVNFFNFDLTWVMSIGCFLEVDFHDRLLWTTISPVVIMGLLGVTYVIAVNKHRASSETLFRKIRQNHVVQMTSSRVRLGQSFKTVGYGSTSCWGDVGAGM